MGKGYNRKFILRIKEMPKVKEDVLKDPILKRIVEVIVKEIDPDKIILFGSRARDDYKEDSDYDILVLKRGIKPEERRKLATRIERIFLDMGIFKIASVDLVVQDTERYGELIERWDLIYYYANEEGIILYERGPQKVA